ncbi:MAG: DUF1440 domain-containing protein [Candidatus Sulfotelmatobacter sp.]
MLLGAAAGMSGAWAMVQFTRLWNKVFARPQSRKPLPLPYSQQEWNATSTIAESVASSVLGRHLTAREKRAGAIIVHYAVGSAAGAFYAVSARHSTAITRCSGALFGLAIWLLENNLLLPLAGMSARHNRYSLLDHANSLGEHLIFAVTTDALYRCANSRQQSKPAIS